MHSKRLPRSFYKRDTVKVAQDLIGKYLVFGDFTGQIIETEAYKQEDPACHAFNGETPRTKIMFGNAGISYVYFIYGMYHCLNVVTEDVGRGCAVLIRSVLPTRNDSDKNLYNGPGKLCKALGIGKKHNGIDLCENDFFYIRDNKKSSSSIKKGKRIGIKKGKNLLWRFYI